MFSPFSAVSVKAGSYSNLLVPGHELRFVGCEDLFLLRCRGLGHVRFQNVIDFRDQAVHEVCLFRVLHETLETLGIPDLLEVLERRLLFEIVPARADILDRLQHLIDHLIAGIDAVDVRLCLIEHLIEQQQADQRDVVRVVEERTVVDEVRLAHHGGHHGHFELRNGLRIDVFRIGQAVRAIERNAVEVSQISRRSDAHVECDILRHRYALELLETLHFPEELVVNRSVDALMTALAEKKA